MRMINAATESLPKLFLFGLIIVQSGAASTASISSYVSLALVFANMITMCDCVMAEFVPEIASVAPPAVGAAAARPTTRSVASTMCHFFSTSAGLAALVVFISAFMGYGPLQETKTPPP